jgi:quercetin dioxygenase-like cupin family protein
MSPHLRAMLPALNAALLASGAVAVHAADEPKAGIVTPLMTKDLTGIPNKEGTMLTVQYLPGGASLAHRHNAHVFVYVLEGSVNMQVDGQPAVTLTAGQTFYENPTDVHRVSRNASATQPAKILVFMVKDKDKPATLPAAGK